MLPYIQKQLSLHTVNSIRELIRVSRGIEETELRVHSFCPPPTNFRQLLEPQHGYRKPISSVAPVSTVRNTDVRNSNQLECGSTPTAAISDQQANTGNAVTCWNCKGTGHRFRKCEQTRRVFCFKCGYDNVPTYKCPNCQRNVRSGQQ